MILVRHRGELRDGFRAHLDVGLDELWVLEPGGAIERRPLDLSPEKTCQGLLVALAAREGFTQVWLSAPYAAAAGLPHDFDNQAVRDGVKHRFAKFEGAPSVLRGRRLPMEKLSNAAQVTARSIKIVVVLNSTKTHKISTMRGLLRETPV